MEDRTLGSQGARFALAAGAIAFFLALLVTANGNLALGHYAKALIPAIVCAAMCWASARRIVAETAEAIDRAVERLGRAARGDLADGVPAETRARVPRLAAAMDALFAAFAASIARVERLAMFDPVTGLASRASFRDAAEAALAEGGDAAALIFIDLDRFKAVNDTRGHAVGDMLLYMVAERLRHVVGEHGLDGGALIGRLAGDEFTVLLPGCAPARAAALGDALVAALGAPYCVQGIDVSIGASIGLASHPRDGVTLHDLMRAADAAMYRAKAAGRGAAVTFDPALAAQIAARSRLDAELRIAVAERQFALVYQPQVSLDGEMVAAEALLRWAHPGGERQPAAFLPRAEETGLVVEIGDWVVGEVAATIARWHAAGHRQRLAINVSQREIDHAAFFARLRAALARANAPARLLELELSETLAMRCSDAVVEAIAALRRDGATVAIDGFGTGYSNLARLRDLPVDRIKLHRSLVEPIAVDADARAVVQAVVGLVHGLGREAVGEGIETRAQAEMLRVIGCDAIQGFAIAPPMRETALLDWMGASVHRTALAG